MGLFDLFRRISTWTPEELRRFLDDHSAEDYQLIDVRQPREYQEGHLPGAVLIPVSELEDRHGELDPGKKTILY